LNTENSRRKLKESTRPLVQKDHLVLQVTIRTSEEGNSRLFLNLMKPNNGEFLQIPKEISTQRNTELFAEKPFIADISD